MTIVMASIEGQDLLKKFGSCRQIGEAMTPGIGVGEVLACGLFQEPSNITVSYANDQKVVFEVTEGEDQTVKFLLNSGLK